MATVEVKVNCPDHESATEVATTLVMERLAAASNVSAPIESRYWWQGEVRVRSELTVVLKTRSELARTVIDRVVELHPYETPAVWAVTPTDASPAYEQWVIYSTVDPGKPRA